MTKTNLIKLSLRSEEREDLIKSNYFIVTTKSFCSSYDGLKLSYPFSILTLHLLNKVPSFALSKNSLKQDKTFNNLALNILNLIRIPSLLKLPDLQTAGLSVKSNLFKPNNTIKQQDEYLNLSIFKEMKGGKN
jgi:hypothetical protein